MNNIYKVIWSKAKNCYVVASEIARSHTKSASGSEKVREGARHALLALGAACAIACGGFVNVGAAEYEHVDVQTAGGSTAQVYTKDGTESYVEHALTHFDTKPEVDEKIEALKTGDVTTNKNNIRDLQTTTTTQGNQIAINTTNIAHNTAAIDKKIDTDIADLKYAAKTALDGKANIDLSNLTEAGKSAIKNTMSADMDSKANKADVYSRTDADDKFATKDALNGKADQTALNQATDRITANEAAITGLTTKNTDQQKAIDDLKKKTAEISHEAGNGTNISGVTIKNGNIVGDGNSAITGLTNVETGNINGKSLVGTTVATAKDVEDAVKTETDARTAADIALEGKITKNSQDIATLGGKVTTAQGDIQTNANNIQTNKNDIAATNKRTSGIEYDNVRDETTIENNVVVDSIGNVTAKGQLTAYDGVYTGTGDITTKGDVNAGSLKVENASQLKGDVTMDKTLSVTGDTKLKKTDVDGTLNVTGESSLKNTKVDGTLTTTGKATFKEAVEMDKGLTVTSGDTTLKGTKVDGALNVTGESSLKNTKVDGTLTTTGKATFKEAVEMDKGLTVTNGATTLKETTVDGKLTAGDADLKNTQVGGTLNVTGDTTLEGALTAKGEAKFTENVTVGKDLTVDGKLNVGEIYLENNKLEPTGKKHDSATSITADGISNLAKVTELGHTTESQFTHNEKGTFNYAKDEKSTGEWKGATSNVTADGVSNKMTDSDGNTHTYYQTATESKEQLVNGDKSKSNFEKKTAEGNTISIKDKDAAGNNQSLTNTQTVDGEKTSVTNKDSSSTINQGADQIRNYVASTDGTKSSTEVKADGITNTSDGTITNDAKDIVNNATGNMTNTVGGDLTTTVGGNELHEVTGTKTENVTGMVKENYSNGQETNVTGNQDIHVTGKQTNKIDGDQENTIGGDQTTTVTGDISNTAKNITNEATTKLTDKVGANTRVLDGEGITDTVGGSTLKSRVTQKKGSIEAVVTDGTSFNHSRDIANASAKTLTGYNKMNQLLDDLNSSTKTIKNEDGKTTKTEQTALDITNTAKDGTITNDAKDIVNNASGNMTNTVGGDLKTTVAGNELREVTGTKTENVTGKVTENYGNGQETNVTGDQYLHVTGKQTNKIDGDQENIIGGNQTTTVTGDISNKAENITNEANTKLTDKVGDHTRVLDSDGITDTVGGSTFKQRIDKIMMESKDVSIKAEETLTNEAKVITNKASEVINNEAVNINNTATGIITSKASEIQNQADKLISNKVGENTWENMEDGKITTSIKNGTKQNLTQSDAAGTTQSTVDGGKSTVTIQNADGLADAVTDGTNTSVQNQTASAIAAAVKDGAGNENASVANATTSANTIKSGSKANTVISTADGTSFINSEAAAPVGDGTEVKTTIKGNTITTGKVTMDYAEVMKDLGVRGNANITGKTTTGSLEVTGTSTLKGDVTMESNATVKKDLTVEGNTNLKNTKVDGTLDVTQKATFGDSVSIAKDLSVDGNATIKGDVTAKSYKVGDKTYISAAGINANDQKITNVADGSISEGSKDAVNGGQLYTVKNDLEGKVNKVGANAAAMANLHPMEFDPDSKWNIAAAIGNYGSESAAALGAFYRPNDDVMVNLSTAFGTGENMVGGGVSVRLGKGSNKLSREENNALKAQVADLTARMDALLSVLNPNMSKDFPDVPENHWAYEAVSRLAGNDIVQGYPDGEFHGERTMTRYEMAEIIYNALSRGAEAEKELVEEFKPELQAMAASEKATAERAEG